MTFGLDSDKMVKKIAMGHTNVKKFIEKTPQKVNQRIFGERDDKSVN